MVGVLLSLFQPFCPIIIEQRIASATTVDSETVLRSAKALVLRVSAPPQAPCSDGGPDMPRSPMIGQAKYAKHKTPLHFDSWIAIDARSNERLEV
ncbi:hypothetical protein PoB_004827200 [Plakobranchus ocellatus]|uniref:Secreted protein n=1 Tax=Plakobranchus ocellatus TaxID=259542 RepID=A0AAV4BS09_9GAST|nr:hypothetical protein PoB_004827200 [Plakobranchus ocellatus]